MKVISLVPSITETLIEAQIEVVGRTRYCIHPEEKVKSIAIVGGTKTLDWNKVKALNADLLILDKEENPKSFADESPLPFLATHIQDLLTLSQGLKYLGRELKSSTLSQFSERVDALKIQKRPLDLFADWITPRLEPSKLEYVIWKDPLMTVSQNTFIGSVLESLGHSLPLHESKYPKLSHPLDQQTTYLFSSEPYPFLKNREWIKSLGVSAATVDGESFSWFGIRSLRFLEKLLK